MSESIKLNDNKYIDATGVYDSTLNQTQSLINSKIHFAQISGTTDSYGIINIGIATTRLVAALCTNVLGSICVPKGGNVLRIYAGNDASTTSETFQMVLNTDVVINFLYYDF